MMITVIKAGQLIDYQWRCKCGWACYVSSTYPLTYVRCRKCGVALEQGEDVNKTWKVVKTDGKEA